MIDRRHTDALDASVLVLNRSFAAIHVVSVRRAIRLLCCEAAEVVYFENGQFGAYDFGSWCELSQMEADEKREDEDWIQSVRFELRAPRVIRLLRYNRVPRGGVRLNRRNVLLRDDFSCQYCGGQFPHSQLSLDHVMPRSRGGDSSWENLVCACIKCNVRKGARTPKEASMDLSRKPKRPRRSPILLAKLQNPKYESWKIWLGNADGVRG